VELVCVVLIKCRTRLC